MTKTKFLKYHIGIIVMAKKQSVYEIFPFRVRKPVGGL